MQDCRGGGGGGGGVGVGGGRETRVELEDLGQCDMTGREGTLKSLVRLICNVCAWNVLARTYTYSDTESKWLYKLSVLLPPTVRNRLLSTWDLSSSEILHNVDWYLYTDVSGQPIDPISKSWAVQEEDREHLRYGNTWATGTLEVREHLRYGNTWATGTLVLREHLRYAAIEGTVWSVIRSQWAWFEPIFCVN